MNAWWESLSMRSRVVLGSSTAAMLVLLAAAGWWLLRPDPAVLFSDLRPQDAAALGAELDKLKIPYAVGDNGATLLVDRAQVHAVRMKLMGREVPLHGTVGLELFNTTDFGMTEFAQKVNFQRALQGELTRTILSFPEIRDARVHLVLPDQGLFRQGAARAKAAITLGLRPGLALRAEQVAGIQRLVAAAVPALSPNEVTIVDQQGVPLTRADSDADPGTASTRLELKRETEQYLARKATTLLEQVFGPGQALASVDVTLNMDSIRLTTEDIIPAADGKGSTGVLVRERETARDNSPLDARSPDARGMRGSSMQRDAEYQAGRRVEQVVSQPGTIRRIQVVAVVRETLSDEQQQHLERMLAASVGASSERGDSVVVQPLKSGAAGAAPTAPPPPDRAGAAVHPVPEWTVLLVVALAAAITLALTAALVAARRRRIRALPVLTDDQRRAALERVQGWMLEAAVVPDRTGATR